MRVGNKDTAIESVSARVLRTEATGGVEMSFAPLRYRTAILIEVRTRDGLAGYGESWVNYPEWAYLERIATLEHGVFPIVLGSDASDIEGIHDELVRRLEPLGRQWGAAGPIMQAISGVDIALWDLAGRRTELSTSHTMGGRIRETSLVYASSLGPGDVKSQAGKAASAGYTAMKLKLGFGVAQDIEALQAARDASPDATLFADANQAWSISEAVKMAPILSEYEVAWTEEPIRGDALEDLEELHRRTGLKVATGENLYRVEAFRRYGASPAIAVLQPDVCKVGGLTRAISICSDAADSGTAVVPHFYGGAIGLAATLQLAAHAPAVALLEYDIRNNPFLDRKLTDLPRPVEGNIDIPDGPGLGVKLNERSIGELTITGAK